MAGKWKHNKELAILSSNGCLEMLAKGDKSEVRRDRI